MTLLAIDFGERRVGVAVSDPEQRFAIPVTTLLRRSDRQVVSEIVALAGRHGVEEVVVGEPLELDGTRGPAAARVRSFAGKLASALAVPCTLVDERLTTVEAAERLEAAGPRVPRERLDAIAAQVLLEDLLSARRSEGGGR